MDNDDLRFSTGMCLVGDARERLRDLPDGGIGAVITDPPYEIGFRTGWDRTGVAFDPALWAEVLRVTAPGGYLLAFGAARTSHRMTCAIEDAGWEIRDQLDWIYASGMPKSTDLGAAMGEFTGDGVPHQEWGTALKPAHEPIVLARRPFAGPVSSLVAATGVGGLHIGAALVGTDVMVRSRSTGEPGQPAGVFRSGTAHEPIGTVVGRWPANVLLSADAAADLDARIAGASRYFFCSKASRGERRRGVPGDIPAHATVKPLDLIRHLVRLVTPPGRTVIDPFLGSGTTAVACVAEGVPWIGCELTAAHLPLIDARVTQAEADRAGVLADAAESCRPVTPGQLPLFPAA